MLVKQKEANRQSMILLQNADPSLQLLKALEDVSAITKTLEEERLQHQQKVKEKGAFGFLTAGSSLGQDFVQQWSEKDYRS